MKKLLLVIALCPAFVFAAHHPSPKGADSSFFNLSLTPDIAIYKRHTKIQGFILGIWSENPQAAFSLGIVNGSTGDSAGFALGLFNYADSYTGFHFSIANWTKKDFLGVQAGAGNYTAGTITGAQVGFVNFAGRINGVQIGLVNYAESAGSGVQVGIVNILSQNTRWFGEFPKAVAPFMVLANWRFN